MSNEDVVGIPGDQEYIFGPLIPTTWSNDSTDNENTEAGHSVSAPIDTLCIDLREEVEKVDTAILRLVKLVDHASAYYSPKSLNIRPQTDPIVLELSRTIATFMSHVINAFVNLSDAIDALSIPFNCAPTNADGSPARGTDFDRAIAAYEHFPQEHAAARDMLPRVHDALRDAQERLLGLLAFRRRCDCLPFHIIPWSCIPDHIQCRQEALDRLPVLLPSIGTSIDTIADRFEQICHLFYAIAKYVTVQRIKKEESSEKYHRDVGKLAELMISTAVNIQHARTNAGLNCTPTRYSHLRHPNYRQDARRR
ncbi:hypothetical protein FISHEDRAFT_73589 [Fistulina hepatica ATCC 64428]|uniref:Uncharacterized protein n=1 Tax=Fistulina hepatica ATCC 64428 TaxID=1128425 RepID=A0A0D7ADX5_9AGAR|nr:hypothetical protein FISHEDRAFT_73589 [Fistulina hepatica ATCC 64428]